MNINTIISEILALTFLILAPNVFSIILSICGTVYFLGMIKINILDRNYQGSWLTFFKKTIKSLFKK